MQKRNLLICLLFLFFIAASCVVRRPPLSPRRPDNATHRDAKTIAECLECHGGENAPAHGEDRGDCLKCHRLDRS